MENESSVSIGWRVERGCEHKEADEISLLPENGEFLLFLLLQRSEEFALCTLSKGVRAVSNRTSSVQNKKYSNWFQPSRNTEPKSCIFAAALINTLVSLKAR
jgi:hypothetical protein